MKIIEKIKQDLKTYHRKINIIFPEGKSILIQKAAIKLKTNNINPLLVFQTRDDIPSDLNNNLECLVINEYNTKDLANYLFELRKNKLSLEEANNLVLQPNYFSVLLVKKGFADGMVGGISYSSADILRPSLQIIKTKPGYSLASSVFLMLKDNNQFIFTDCALNVYPNAEQLAKIAELGYEASQIFKFDDPRIGFLSYSTYGSGKGEHVDIVTNACQILNNKNWDKCEFDGELQFDSAIIDAVRHKKAPSSKLTKSANILVFPNLDAGNIGYKIAQRLGGYEAIGPIIFGLDKPVNDLSRGATDKDIFKISLITSYIYKYTQNKN